MKTLIACALGLMLCFSPMNTNITDFNSTIHKGGFFHYSLFSEDLSKPVIIKTHEDMHYINKIMDNFRNDVYTHDQLLDLESQVKQFYTRYTDKFFKDNALVIALIDRGSGSVQYSVSDVKVDSKNHATITINRKSPMIQTMDYIHWVLTLETHHNIDSAEIVLVEQPCN